ncbi:hypothetical protein WJ968_07690 [Achromobacter xylosoxidans]
MFVPISGALVECDSPGVTSSDYDLFAYQRRQRRCIRWSRWRSRTIAPRLERRAAILSNGGLRAR